MKYYAEGDEGKERCAMLPNERHPVSRPVLALALLAPAPTLGAAMALWIAPGPVGQAVYAAAKLWLLIFPLAWTVLIAGEPVLARIRTGPRPARGLAVGAGLGVVIGAGIIAAYALLVTLTGPIDPGRIREVAASAGLGTPARFLLFGAYLAIVNALLEEYVWRWFVYRACATVMPGWLAVPASAALFTAHHVVVLAAYFTPGVTAAASLGVFIGGCAWSWCYRRYGSVWPGYVCHAIVDAAILAVGRRLLFG